MNNLDDIKPVQNALAELEKDYYLILNILLGLPVIENNRGFQPPAQYQNVNFSTPLPRIGMSAIDFLKRELDVNSTDHLFKSIEENEMIPEEMNMELYEERQQVIMEILSTEIKFFPVDLGKKSPYANKCLSDYFTVDKSFVIRFKEQVTESEGEILIKILKSVGGDLLFIGASFDPNSST